MDSLRFREVVPNQASQEQWKEVVLNTGGSQSTLQDIKVTERANGYCYKYYNGKSERNRFIYWRTYHDNLELCEISLDVTLCDNHVRYKFSDSPVLAVTITELPDCVVILVATVNSIHRLYFPHPDRVLRHDGSDFRATSIFKEASAAAAKDPTTSFVIAQHSFTNNPPHTATCFLSETGQEAYFAVACSTNLLLYTMNCATGHTVTTELRQSQIVPRILTNFAGALRGKSASDGSFVNSVVFKQIDNQVYLYALYRDDQIRMWSVKKGNCVTTINTLQDYGENRMQGSQSNILALGPRNSVCVFMCFATGCEFKTFDTYDEGGGHYTMALTGTVPAPQFDLIDFKMVGNRIWALWCNADGEFDISTMCLDAGSINWISVGLEVPPDQSCINSDTDPRQEYCSYIFGPGRFQRSTIAKALVMFRRSNVMADAGLPMHMLKERVCQAVEAELQNEIKDLDITDEEYIEINLQLWERFYSCCEQYHLKATQPIGLVSLDPVGGLCIVKKNMYTLVRPCEFLERLMLASDQVNQIRPLTGANFGDHQIEENVVQLVAVLSKIESVLPDAVKIEIYNRLMELQMPNNIITELVRQFLSPDVDDQPFTKDFLAEIRQMLLLISDLPHTMMVLLEALRLNKLQEGENLLGGEVDDDCDGDDSAEAMDVSGHHRPYHGIGDMDTSRSSVGMSNLFCSNTGKSFVAESLKQIVGIRYTLCRNLLILQHLLGETVALSHDVLEQIRSNCMTDTAIFVQAYFVTKWICESPINIKQIVANQKGDDSMNQMLNSLHLFDTFPSQRTSASTAIGNQYTVLEYFLHGRASILGLVQMVNTVGGGMPVDRDGKKGQGMNAAEMEMWNGTANWQQTLIGLIKRVAVLIWPVAGNFTFGEWLIGTGQYIMIEEYVRLLNSWCEWNRSSRDFILAITMLNNGELYKAYDYFMSATAGITNGERFLIVKVLDAEMADAGGRSKQSLVAQYYLKVVQMFEQKPALDCVIRMAKAAIEILSEVALDDTMDAGDQSRRAMFQSIVFMNQLKLEHYEEAYDSLINNVEVQRRKEGLRQLVVCLFQKKRVDLLMHFPYVGLQQEFEAIVEMRARSMGVEENIHYKFLYAYHVTKENMRKAAFCMYEQAMRLQFECDAVAAVEARYESLLACVNALHLVDERYQFIAKPVVTKENAKTDEKLSVEVLEIGDIKREMVHTEAILCLHRFKQQRENRGTGAGAAGMGHEKIMRLDGPDLIAVLLSSHLYTMAMRLAKTQKLSVVPIIKSLTATCIELSEEQSTSTDSWFWLQENNVTDLPASNSAVDTAWNLLKKLIQENEQVGATELGRAAAALILSSTTAFVPRWLWDSLRVNNPNELLLLLVKHGRLIEASEFAIEYVWAMLGRGPKYFGLHNTLLPNGAALCFPVNTMDLLLYSLRMNIDENADKLVAEDVALLKDSLKQVMDVCQYYREKVIEVSLARAQYKKQMTSQRVV